MKIKLGKLVVVVRTDNGPMWYKNFDIFLNIKFPMKWKGENKNGKLEMVKI